MTNAICKRDARFPTDRPPYCSCVGGECAKASGTLPRPYPEADETPPPKMPWTNSAPDRVSPRECIRAARDALNNAYSHPGVTGGQHSLVFIAEAVDWQRRALEQMMEPPND